MDANKVWVLEDGIHEHSSQHGTATLVAQDIAQCRGVLHDFLSVVQATVGSSSQDTGNTLLLLAEGAGSTHQVTIYLNSLRRENTRQQLTHVWCMSWCTSATIEHHVEV